MGLSWLRAKVGHYSPGLCPPGGKSGTAVVSECSCNQENQDTETICFVFLFISGLWVCLVLPREWRLGDRVSGSCCFLPGSRRGLWGRAGMEQGQACPADRGQQVAARNPRPLGLSSDQGLLCWLLLNWGQ